MFYVTGSIGFVYLLQLLAYSLIQHKIDYQTTGPAIPKIRSEIERSQTLN